MVKSDDKQFIIPFVGLKQGKHEFQFEVTDKFFETFEYSIIQEGDVHVDFILDKKDTMMVGEFQLNGCVNTFCARCNDPMEVPIEGEFRLVYKFATEPTEDETLVIVFPEEFEINIKHSILEFINVLVPARAVHPEGECNEEMLEHLSNYIVYSVDEQENDDEYDPDDDRNEEFDEEEIGHDDQEDEEPIDPRWAALKNLNKD